KAAVPGEPDTAAVTGRRRFGVGPARWVGAPLRARAELASSRLVDGALDLFLGVAVGRLRLAGGLVDLAFALQLAVAERLAGVFLDAALGLVDAALDLFLVHAESSHDGCWIEARGT